MVIASDIQVNRDEQRKAKRDAFLLLASSSLAGSPYAKTANIAYEDDSKTGLVSHQGSSSPCWASIDRLAVVDSASPIPIQLSALHALGKIDVGRGVFLVTSPKAANYSEDQLLAYRHLRDSCQIIYDQTGADERLFSPTSGTSSFLFSVEYHGEASMRIAKAIIPSQLHLVCARLIPSILTWVSRASSFDTLDAKDIPTIANILSFGTLSVDDIAALAGSDLGGTYKPTKKSRPVAYWRIFDLRRVLLLPEDSPKIADMTRRLITLMSLLEIWGNVASIECGSVARSLMSDLSPGEQEMDVDGISRVLSLIAESTAVQDFVTAYSQGIPIRDLFAGSGIYEK